MNVKYYIRSNYGSLTMYLVGDESDRLVIALHHFNGHKTMTDGDKKAFESLGYTFTEVLAPKK